MQDTVTCHSEYDYAEKPVSLNWQGKRREISNILDAWRTPDGKGFRVETVDGQVFVLLYNQASDDWQILQS